MSNLLYPTRATLAQTATPDRGTDFGDNMHIFTALSGKESRLSYGATPRRRWTVEHNTLRENVFAPAPYATIFESDFPEYFLSLHGGALDSFLFVDPFSVSAVQVRVRFEKGSLTVQRNAGPGFRKVKFTLVEVL